MAAASFEQVILASFRKIDLASLRLLLQPHANGNNTTLKDSGVDGKFHEFLQISPKMFPNSNTRVTVEMYYLVKQPVISEQLFILRDETGNSNLATTIGLKVLL